MLIDVLSRGWRLLATALSFASFGLGGLVLRLVLFPVVRLLARDVETRMRWSRGLVRGSFRLFVRMMRALGVLSYELRGVERLDRRGLLILANHPSLIDVAFLMAFVRNADCVVKDALWRNPFTRGPVEAAGFVSNRTGPELVDACVASVRGGSNLIIFPEGTRTKPDTPLVFQRGAANVAVRGGLDVTPVVIRCRPTTLTKGEPWWAVPARRPHFTFEVGCDIPVAPYVQETAPSAAARELTRNLQSHFSLELSRHG
ncbi:lysophospholipid acyltransferase family protein [Niveibacterium sp. SC-1]|uniref:lysophospholipid acyltransferase family protein n=1 Tax=Niveibacterium sp. SC-1 TaxID=3135646 RepID=UPI00311F37F0